MTCIKRRPRGGGDLVELAFFKRRPRGGGDLVELACVTRRPRGGGDLVNWHALSVVLAEAGIWLN